MITYILQYEIPQTEFFRSRSWPTFLGYDLIDISSNMYLQLVYVSSQCQVVSHLHVMTYLFDLQNTLNS